MNQDNNEALRIRGGVKPHKALLSVEVKDMVESADAKRPKEKKTKVAQTTHEKGKGKARAFNVFEPSSQSKRSFSVTLHTKT
jgi:hypothetical protein